jgi:hypothetical protein
LPVPAGILPDAVAHNDITLMHEQAFGSRQNAANCEQNARAPHQLSTTNYQHFRLD